MYKYDKGIGLGKKLDVKTIAFIEDVADDLISRYEENTGKKYNPKDINSCVDIINFIGGNVVYVNNLHTKYDIEELLISEENNEFTIILDRRYVEDNAKIPVRDLKDIMFRMVWFWFKENLKNDWSIESNKILYPKKSEVIVNELEDFIEKNKYVKDDNAVKTYYKIKN